MKAILVIDMPSNCNECSLKNYEYGCVISGPCGGSQTRPEWCPLKPMPTKQEHKKGLCSDYILGFEDGWSDCLDEILGEIE